MKLIKLGAPWCGPCNIMDERLKDFSACEYVHYNIDDENDAATQDAIEKYKVRNIPLLVLEDDNGHELNRWVGAVPVSSILKEIEKYK